MNKLRERIIEQLDNHFEIIDTRGKGLAGFVAWHELEITEAERRGREERNKEFINFVKEQTSFPRMRLLDREELLNFLSLK